jgi:hypothetical protein
MGDIKCKRFNDCYNPLKKYQCCYVEHETRGMQKWDCQCFFDKQRRLENMLSSFGDKYGK